MRSTVRVDGRTVQVPEEISTLEGILQHVLANEVADDKEVVEVRVDGNVFNEEFPHEAMIIDTDEFSSVDVITEDREKLAEMTLAQTPYFISAIKTGFRTASELLRDIDTQNEGHQLLAHSAESLNALIAHLMSIIQNLRNGKCAELLGAYQSLTDDIVGLIDEIILSQKEDDSYLLADLLEFEIVPILDRLGERIEKVLN